MITKSLLKKKQHYSEGVDTESFEVRGANLEPPKSEFSKNSRLHLKNDVTKTSSEILPNLSSKLF